MHAAPFIALTKGACVNTATVACQRAFDYLKDALLKLPLLHYVDPKKPFILDTDASDTAIGACLSQVAVDGDGTQYERTIAFGSKTLCKSRRAYCTTKRELYAVVYFMRYWRCFTAGFPVLIRTDHGVSDGY